MNARQLEEFFARIDLDPECASQMDLPEGWRVARPSDFAFVREVEGYDREAGYEASFRIEGPWALAAGGEGEVAPSATGHWMLPDDSSTVIVFRPDEDTATATTEPPRPTKWPAWDRLCQ